MEKREMTVYRKRGTSREYNPLIMLQGRWLRDMGFSIGDRILVSCEDGRLIVERTGGIWLDPKGEWMVAEETVQLHLRIRNMKCFTKAACQNAGGRMCPTRRWFTALELVEIQDKI